MDTKDGHQPPSIPTRPIPIQASKQPTPLNGSNGYKISVRFGDQVLQAGFTSVPNLVLNHYAKLGITPAEMLFTIHMWQFRWTERDPYPSLTTIASKMNVSWRQAHRYAKSLAEKGFLIIKSRQEPGRGQVTSEYDFESLIKAVLKLDGGSSNESNEPDNNPNPNSDDKRTTRSTPLSSLSGGGMTSLTGEPLSRVSDEEYVLEEDPSQKDVNHSNIREAKSPKNREYQEPNGSSNISTVEDRDRSRGEGFSPIGATLARSNLSLPPKPYGEERQVIMDYVDRFAKEFNDHASLKTSTTRAYNLFTRSKLPLGGFIGRMYEAQAFTKESAARIPKKRVQPSTQSTQLATMPRGRPAKNKMAYWFSVLEDRLGLRKARGSVQQLS